MSSAFESSSIASEEEWSLKVRGVTEASSDRKSRDMPEMTRRRRTRFLDTSSDQSLPTPSRLTGLSSAVSSSRALIARPP